MNTFSGLIMFSIILIVMLAMMLPLYARAITFIPPVDCEIGTDCFIQNYVDVDPFSKAIDYRCGDMTYDGHKGTDFRLRDLLAMKEGVNVIAAAGGVIKAVRNDMPDHLKGDVPYADIRGKECGNGVVIEHVSGFESQYCHMMQQSVLVEEGQRVARGAVLGKIGYSGKTQFPHLHFAVRKDDEIMDPFSGLVGEAICGEQESNLWHQAHKDELVHQENLLLNLHFSTDKPVAHEARSGEHRTEKLAADDAMLILWSDTMALLGGDEVALKIVAPNGSTLAKHSVITDRFKAQQFVFTGKRRPAGGWEKGEYTGHYTVIRGGQPIDNVEKVIRLVE